MKKVKKVEKAGKKESGKKGIEQLVGKAFFFRAVTYHLVGKVVGILYNNTLVLSDAAWVVDSGRFSLAIGKGNLSETEFVGTAYLNLDTVTDFFPWKHSLPSKGK